MYSLVCTDKLVEHPVSFKKQHNLASALEGCHPAWLCREHPLVLSSRYAQVAIEEVRRLQRFGVTAGELERYKMALLRDSAQAAEQALSVPSADQLDFIMESLALGHTVLDQRQVQTLFQPFMTLQFRAHDQLPLLTRHTQYGSHNRMWLAPWRTLQS